MHCVHELLGRRQIKVTLDNTTRNLDHENKELEFPLEHIPFHLAIEQG